MINTSKIIFIHGSGGEKSRTYKAEILRDEFPGIIIPDFEGELADRMYQLELITGTARGWNLIGSSLGGLMAALFTSRNPDQVEKQILLAPALTMPEFNEHIPNRVSVPTIILHGLRDELLPIQQIRSLAEKVFTDLNFIIVDDDHRLHRTAETINWKSLINTDYEKAL